MKSVIHIAFFAALTAASGFVRIPMFPVPFTLQSLAVYLSGSLLGAKKAALSQILFLIIGLSGLPIFAWGGGPAYVFQPTFGYLLGFPAAAWVIGFLLERHSGPIRFRQLCILNVPGMLLIHLTGVVYLYVCMNLILGKRLAFTSAFISGSFVFLPAEIFKIVCSAGLTLRIKRIFRVAPGIVLILLLYPNRADAQNPSRLNHIKKEIQLLESELKTKEAKETTLLEQLENLEREIGLRKKLLAELELERGKGEKAVHGAQINLEQAVDSRKRQRDLVLRRIKMIYQRGRMAEWEALVSMNSLNQALVWIKYQKRIMENDRRNFRLLQEKEMQVDIQKKALEAQLDQKQRLIRETGEEKRKCESDQDSRKKLLAQVSKEKKSIQERLREKRQAFQKIESWIVQEENRRIEKEKKKRALERTVPQPVYPPNVKPIWPVKGRIVSGYGRQMDPATRTWTENLGVDIETQQEEKVLAAMSGQVKYVTWLRGMGNLVLLDHGGLYTVYGHLDAVYVTGGETVDQGKTIGQVGNRMSLYGTILHFEVWKGTTHYDPLHWLR